ncbi:MAG: PilT/PilU family type 4a pilus ATPase [Candidatus Peregrinibacteria bacterium]|nr:PilT/PilU family type 4a pilus ATPase [Candidatus Peregrinibacteria bacterium]MCB9807677.1 PilT/PilU family type 4a pilus ATPase [Candidatus Peribacteria bacterium]
MPQTSTPDTIFTKAADMGASDVHIAVNSPLLFRIDGELEKQGKENTSAEKVKQFIKSVLGAEAYKRFEADREIDASYSTKKGVRLRVNCHFERGNPGLAARIIPTVIPTLEEIGLSSIKHLCEYDQGLILFTGPTGAGKSTSLAAMIQHISHDKGGHIVTLEDPIEFIFQSEKALIRQRQFGSDFLSFPEALKRVLRQDPDIIMVGEMRDLETIAAALTMAETGHLVFGTLHTPNATQTIDRIIDVFPPHQQSQIRTQLSLSLRAVIAQRLIPCAQGGRIAQREVLINTPAVGNIIRDGRAQELSSVIQTGRDTGMCTYKKCAKELYKEGLIDKETFEWARQ